MYQQTNNNIQSKAALMARIHTINVRKSTCKLLCKKMHACTYFIRRTRALMVKEHFSLRRITIFEPYTYIYVLKVAKTYTSLSHICINKCKRYISNTYAYIVFVFINICAPARTLSGEEMTYTQGNGCVHMDLNRTRAQLASIRKTDLNGLNACGNLLAHA